MKRQTNSCLPALCCTFHSDTFCIAVLDSWGWPTECSNIQHLHLNLIISLLEVYKELVHFFVLVPIFLKYLILWIFCMSFGLQIFMCRLSHCLPLLTVSRNVTCVWPIPIYSHWKQLHFWEWKCVGGIFVGRARGGDSDQKVDLRVIAAKIKICTYLDVRNIPYPQDVS